MVELEVVGLAVDAAKQSPVLVLRAAEIQKVLPLFIGATEAVAISLALNEVPPPRPMTHDLLLSVILGLGAEVERVEITAMDGETYYAELVLLLEGEEVRMDSRPSDGVAFALRAKCPMLIDELILEAAGVDDLSESEREAFKESGQEVTVATSLEKLPDPDASPVQKSYESDEEEWIDILDNMSLDKLKYKM
ncbi:MAG: bifunctional nuclease family protein [Desulfovibrio sp.]